MMHICICVSFGESRRRGNVFGFAVILLVTRLKTWGLCGSRERKVLLVLLILLSYKNLDGEKKNLRR